MRRKRKQRIKKKDKESMHTEEKQSQNYKSPSYFQRFANYIRLIHKTKRTKSRLDVKIAEQRRNFTEINKKKKKPERIKLRPY